MEGLKVSSKGELSSKKTPGKEMNAEAQKEMAPKAPVKCCPMGGKGSLKKRGCISCPPEGSQYPQTRKGRKKATQSHKPPLKEKPKAAVSTNINSDKDSLKAIRRIQHIQSTETSPGLGQGSRTGLKAWGAAKAVGLGIVLTVAPQIHQGLRDAFEGYQTADNWVLERQREMFGPPQSDIDGNVLKGKFIDTLRDVAERTMPFTLAYTRSRYQSPAGYRDRMDAAEKYEHPKPDLRGICLRVRQEPHSNAKYQAYLESINCADIDLCHHDQMHPPCMRIAAPSNKCGMPVLDG
ncbi:hypothetical protein CDD82_442 [Ophiocordyceps australis]|uniref:Uncharacterized protein n=1 Tax=Ophiocordyceps australis TaxID=1399860 RepID=A0A2C5ZUH5_9HYPO|nr:hypothetical protein CDD82_442 [Ophiocordyceps australis]